MENIVQPGDCFLPKTFNFTDYNYLSACAISIRSLKQTIYYTSVAAILLKLTEVLALFVFSVIGCYSMTRSKYCLHTKPNTIFRTYQ